jgi:GNAT superfamily N-acetyltransferase
MNRSLGPFNRSPSISPALAEMESGSASDCHISPDFRQEIELRDGSPALVRPIMAGDKPALIEFHSHLSEDTRFLRYHYSKGSLTEDDLRTFCDVDYRDTLALVAEGVRDGRTVILGVGRYSRLAKRDTAEVAFVVRDSEQNKGIGSILLKHLAEFAWRSGIQTFCGEVLRNNARMLTIFRKCDPAMVQEVDCPSTCSITVSTSEARLRQPG